MLCDVVGQTVFPQQGCSLDSPLSRSTKSACCLLIYFRSCLALVWEGDTRGMWTVPVQGQWVRGRSEKLRQWARSRPQAMQRTGYEASSKFVISLASERCCFNVGCIRSGLFCLVWVLHWHGWFDCLFAAVAWLPAFSPACQAACLLPIQSGHALFEVVSRSGIQRGHASPWPNRPVDRLDELGFHGATHAMRTKRMQHRIHLYMTPHATCSTQPHTNANTPIRKTRKHKGMHYARRGEGEREREREPERERERENNTCSNTHTHNMHHAARTKQRKANSTHIHA